VKVIELIAGTTGSVMDAGRWQPGAEFPILDLTAQFEWKSASSLSFQLGTKDAPIKLPDAPPDFELRGFVVIGWLDIHHPCEGYQRLRVRVGLPDRYVNWESMRDIVRQVIAVLELPAGESYHISLAGLSQQTSMCWPSGTFDSVTRWLPPGASP
jgi:hypothetical protein